MAAAAAAAVLPKRMLTYWLRNTSVQQQDGMNLVFDSMYIAVTRSGPRPTLVEQRGPGFLMPAQSGFGAVCDTLKAMEVAGERVSAADIVEQVEYAFASQRIRVDSMDSDDISFAGPGEPLLELPALHEACDVIRTKRHGQKFRLLTSGLVPASELTTTVAGLVDAGIDKVSVNIAATTPKQFQEIYTDSGDASFNEFCAFVASLPDAGIEVECTAVKRPGLQMRACRSLSESLGASNFRPRSYHP